VAPDLDFPGGGGENEKKHDTLSTFTDLKYYNIIANSKQLLNWGGYFCDVKFEIFNRKF